MKVFITFILVFIISIVSGQAYLLQKGQSSNIVPVRFILEDYHNQAGIGFVHSENGKYDWGLKLDVTEQANLVVTSPFYRHYFYNNPSGRGFAFASSFGYSLLMEKSGRVFFDWTIEPSLYYRIPIWKLIVVPEIDYLHGQNSRNVPNPSKYAFATTIALRTKQGFVSLIPRVYFDYNWNLIYGLGLNFQWVKGGAKY